MSRSPVSARVVRPAASRSYVSVIAAVLSLALVAVVVAVVAFLVVRTSPAIESAERRDPVGTAIAAPTLPESVPFVAPERESEATVADTGRTIAALPTVAAESQGTGPTPTPRIIAQSATAPSPTPSPVSTTPPAPVAAVPVIAVPVVAQAPITSAPVVTPAPVAADPPATTEFASAESSDPPSGDATALQSVDDGEDELPAVLRDRMESRSVGASVANAVELALARRDGGGRAGRAGEEAETMEPLFADREGSAAPPLGASVSDIAVEVPGESESGDPSAVVVPDADQMIEEISARVRRPED